MRRADAIALSGLAAIAGFLLWRRFAARSEPAGELEDIEVTAQRIVYAPAVEPPRPAATVGNALSAIGDAAGIAASKVGALMTSRGYRNNNPGNIRFIARNPWNGQVGDDGGYGIYDTPANGSRALGRQLRKYASRGLVTVRAIITTWAPPSENVTSSYVAHVARLLGVNPDDRIDVIARLGDLAAAIALHENGSAQPWGPAFYQWVQS